MLHILLETFLTFYLLWFFFLAVMALRAAEKTERLTKPAKYFGYPIYFFGLALDCVVNLTLLTIILAEIPKELTCSKRFERLKENTDFRGAISTWFLVNLLAPFDPFGGHDK